MDPVADRPRRAIVVALATAVLAVVAIVSFYVGRPAQAASVVMVGAGDIAHCSTTTDEATAKLLDGISGTVFTLGDNVYNSGTSAEFANCYNPTWGRHKARTKPAVGNHEYLTSGASGYFNYFGAAAGDPKKGYYSWIARLFTRIPIGVGPGLCELLRTPFGRTSENSSSTH